MTFVISRAQGPGHSVGAWDNGRVREERIERGAGLSGLRRYTWWTVPGTTAVVLVLFVGGWVVGGDAPVWARAACAGALAVTVLASVVLLSRRLGLAPTATMHFPWLVAGSMGAAVLGVIPLAYHQYGLWAVAPSILVAIAATFLPPSRQRVLIAIAAVCSAVPGAVVSLLTSDGRVLYAAMFPLGLMVFTAWAVLGPLWVWDIAGRLNEARRLSAELAVKDERLRFAADLHDIQGHHLQVIALKSELAARLATADPARAATEMRQVQQLATQALQETRALIQGYRRTTLAEEITNATRVLAAAGIDATMDLDPPAQPLPEPGRHLLGLVMREATTNVLRHSRATQASVNYRVAGGRAELRITNNGVTADEVASNGTGLASLSERLTAALGELTWHHDREHFVLVASLPLDTLARIQ